MLVYQVIINKKKEKWNYAFNRNYNWMVRIWYSNYIDLQDKWDKMHKNCHYQFWKANDLW